MAENEKVTNIKYKQMDRDPEIKKTTQQMEEFFFGKKGVGLMDALGLTPSKIQKFIDKENEKEFDHIIEENKQYIIQERTERSLAKCLAHYESKGFSGEDEWSTFIDSAQKEAELEVIRELMQKEGMII